MSLPHSVRHVIATGLALVSAAALTACGNSAGGKMSVTFPDPQTLQFQAELTRESNFALNGQILLPPYGDIYFLPAGPQQGFTFGGRLDLQAFLPEGWQFGEVTQLPTGTYFPPYIRSPLVRVPLSDDFAAYLGVRDQKTLGIGWSFIKSDDTAIGIGANYYDAQGNIVMGGLFYPPRKEGGKITVPGGLFIATDLTPFLPSIGGRQNPTATFVADLQQALIDQSRAVDSRKLKMKPYAVENGRVRKFQKSDMEVAQRYFEMLQQEQQRTGSIKLTAPPKND